MTQPATEPQTDPSGQVPPTDQPPTAQPGATKPWGEGSYDEGKAATLIENLRKEKAELQEKARKFDEAERAKMSELDQHKTAADEYKSKATKLDNENARLRAAIKFDLTEAQAARLTGSTAEEILADGEAYAKELGIAPKGPAADPAADDSPAPPEKDITSHRRPTQQPEPVAPRGGRTPAAEPEEDLSEIIASIPR